MVFPPTVSSPAVPGLSARARRVLPRLILLDRPSPPSPDRWRPSVAGRLRRALLLALVPPGPAFSPLSAHTAALPRRPFVASILCSGEPLSPAPLRPAKAAAAGGVAGAGEWPVRAAPSLSRATPRGRKNVLAAACRRAGGMGGRLQAMRRLGVGGGLALAQKRGARLSFLPTLAGRGAGSGRSRCLAALGHLPHRSPWGDALSSSRTAATLRRLFLCHCAFEAPQTADY